jgi:hypothetical protein
MNVQRERKRNIISGVFIGLITLLGVAAVTIVSIILHKIHEMDEDVDSMESVLLNSTVKDNIEALLEEVDHINSTVNLTN